MAEGPERGDDVGVGAASWVDWPLEARRRALALAALALLLAGLSLSRLELEGDASRALVTPAAVALGEARDALGLDELALILVESDAPDAAPTLERAARWLRETLSREPAVRRVGAPVSLDRERWLAEVAIARGALYWEADALRARLDEAGLARQAALFVERLSLPGMDGDRWSRSDPLELSRPALGRILGSGGTADGGALGLVSEDGQARLLAVYLVGNSSDPGAARAGTRAVREACEALREQPWAASLRTGATGGHLMAADSERMIQRDLMVTLTTSLAVAIGLLALALGWPIWRTALLIAPTVWGGLIGLGALLAFDPRLPAISLACAGVLIGLGVDFAIHLVAAVQAEQGATARERLRACWRPLCGRLALAALTSTAAFVAFLSSELGLVRMMGAIAACGIVGCALGAWLLMPSLLSNPPARPVRGFGLLACARACRDRPRATWALVLLASALAALALWRWPLALEDDLRRLQPADSPVLAAQARIETRFASAAEPLLLVVRGADEAAALAAAQRLDRELEPLQAGGLVTERWSLARLLPPLDTQRAALAELRRQPAAERVAALREAFEAEGVDPEALDEELAGVERALAVDAPLTPATLRELGFGELVAHLLATDARGGMALVALRPRRSLWAADARRQLLAELGAAAARAEVEATPTGSAVIADEAASRVARGFGGVSLATVLAVLLVLGLRFRDPRRVLLVLTPALIGTLWSAGIFAALGWRLNLMNLGVLPMVLALGVDDGIHLVADVLDRVGVSTAAAIEQALQASGGAVVQTSLTTALTFGSLALATNRGLASVGVAAAVGVLACMAATLLVLPLVLSRRAS